MATLIIYAGKTGATAKCAQLLSRELPAAAVVNLERDEPILADYETVIIGGGIRLGTLHDQVKKYLVKHEKVLLTKRLGLFICHGLLEQKDEIISKNFPRALLNHAVCIDSFGGELDLAKQKGMNKLIVKMVSKSMADGKTPPPRILTENILQFAARIKN